jgi:hypothetical protein
LPDVEAGMRHWRHLARAEIVDLNESARRLKAALAAPGASTLAERRMRRLLQATVEQTKALTKLLEPLGLEERDEGSETALERALAARIPVSQSLTGYYANIHRDWGWPDAAVDENGASLARVLEVIPDRVKHGDARILVLGAGACRLAYDLHVAVKAEATVATDFNPLMLYAARRIVTGGTVHLQEFPLAPVDVDSTAVSRALKAPAPVDKSFHLVLADAMNPPFAAEAWDVVLTPWLIDIVPQDLKTFIPRLNRLVRPGGVWVNFGSYAFKQQSVARHYGLEEVLAAVTESGFALEKHVVAKLPYLQSPASCHGRVETVLSFAARKTAAVPQPPPYAYLPPWLLDLTQPIPARQEFQTFVMTHAQYAQTVAMIDGKRSAKDIAEALARQHGMPEAMALEAFTGFITTVHEQGLLGARL